MVKIPVYLRDMYDARRKNMRANSLDLKKFPSKIHSGPSTLTL